MSISDKVKAKCEEVYAKALATYGIDLRQVRISFNLKGKCAGRAGAPAYGALAKECYVKLNRDMLLREAADHIIDFTIPHEFAHVICYMRPELGENHNAGWRAVCIALGGNGERTHNEEVVFGKGITYEYTTTTGHKVRVSQKIHNNIQRGTAYRYRNGQGTVNTNCAHQVVGYQGRTLAEPIRQVEAKTPVVDTNKTSPAITYAVKAAQPVIAPPVAGQSKASISRAIMHAGYLDGKTYEEIIAAMIAANGYNRQLARATFKANAHNVGIPRNWGN
jgi:predicted SprT family Zn-dependent metalloprotease